MIETVKIKGEGYLVNGNLSVPKADGNKDYEAVKKWIDGGGIVGAEFSLGELLSQAKELKLTEIDNDFNSAENTPVDYLDRKFFGGAESVTSIDAFVRLTKLAEGTTFTIWDIDGTEHDFSETEANGLILAIGMQASANKFTKKNRKVALNLAKTIEEVSEI